jgi:hypothetical protein
MSDSCVLQLADLDNSGRVGESKFKKGSDTIMPPAINAECARCGTGLAVTNDGTHLTRRVPGQATSMVFCSHECVTNWDSQHCAWCGASPCDGFLAIRVTGHAGADQRFCDVDHLTEFQKVTR